MRSPLLLALPVLLRADTSCFQAGTAYQEPHLTAPNGAYVAAAADCQRSCELNSYCEHFTWYNDSTACWLLSSAAARVARAHAVSGPRRCAEAAAEPAARGVEATVEKVGKLAEVMKRKSKDPEVVADAEKVLSATAVGQLPDREAVYSVLNEASVTMPLAEAEEEGVLVGEDDLKVINGGQVVMEAAEQGASFGAGAPWAGAEVKYCFKPGTSAVSVQNTQSAVAVVKRLVPGIHFKLLNTRGEVCEESPSIVVTSDKEGCFADMGMMTQLLGGSQVMNVPPVCTVGVVLHELLHAMGMAHEQARKDRDDYITIVWQNIRPGMEGQFSVNGNADTQRPYDLLSIMHYGQTSFTKNGLPTIVLTARGRAALGARSLSSVGQREGLSQRDFEQLVDLYNCEKDAAGVYSSCNPLQNTDLLPILLGVFGGLAVCGCGLFAAYWYYCRKRQKGMPAGKKERRESRPLMMGMAPQSPPARLPQSPQRMPMTQPMSPMYRR